MADEVLQENPFPGYSDELFVEDEYIFQVEPQLNDANKEIDINTSSISKPIQDFLDATGYKANGLGYVNIPTGLTRKLLGSQEAQEIYRNFNSANTTRGKIYIEDIVDSQAIRESQPTLLSFMSYLCQDYYNGTFATYGNRSTEHLQENYKDTAQHLLDDLEPLDFASNEEKHLLSVVMEITEYSF